MRFASALLIGGAILTSTTTAFAQDVDWQKVDEAIGRKPAVVAGDVHRYGFPRTDLTVTLGRETTVEEVNAAMKAAADGALEVGSLASRAAGTHACSLATKRSE